jgi:hypothetical protein
VRGLLRRCGSKDPDISAPDPPAPRAAQRQRYFFLTALGRRYRASG